MTKKVHFLFIICISSVFGQQMADSFYFDPVYGPVNETIKPTDVNFAAEEVINTVLQNKIDQINSGGGGILTINSGDYYIEPTIDLKSNVHIQVHAGVTLHMNPQKTLFEASSGSSTKISNFSIVGLGSDNTASGGTDDRFVIRFNTTNLGTGIDQKMSVLRLGNVTNFKFSNCRIIDTYSEPSSIVLSAEVETVRIDSSESKSQLITEVYGSPEKGIIENIYNENGAYGYGLVQMQSGEDIVYRNLGGSGGVTLRLESGLNLNQLFRPENSLPTYILDSNTGEYIERPASGEGSDETEGLPLTVDQQPKINNVFAENISCTNGHAAFTMSPHTIDQGFVSIIGVTSNSCEFAGEIGGAFINNFNREIAAGLDVNDFNILPGSYSAASIVKNVEATFGQNAQLKIKNFDLIPCDLRIDKGEVIGDPNFGVAVNKGLDRESHRGPSLASIDYSGLEGSLVNGVRYPYTVNFDRSTVTAIGFGRNVPLDAVIEGPQNDFEICNSIGTFSQNPFIPSEDRNTPNPLNPDEGGSLLSLDGEKLDMNEGINKLFFPNPAESMITIKIKKGYNNKIVIIDSLGRIVINTTIYGVEELYKLNIAQLNGNSSYILKVNNLYGRIIKM